ncbi:MULTISPECIES: TIGR04211 family SH3 domain-containing protein [Halomonadaceae]|jgi:SH3 domain protein|uniref:SH3 domain-containing protein n=1 Tax=Vreelandella janggokensis TaxID=370767 RepID=A0ABT4IPG0_9GAMM|nr:MULTISPECIES: TIGR04211 family SH3 domain-containing protein [Halomonas]MCW4152406.1 TIGR04211 family SH3 domain-containing protein [Halomonas sp. 18H]MCZ0925547.1 SH3 domain-containing protein [Halomonas janggokensis]MDR5886942.1 TIGR04211 family SH3 domain-containing protein [Halomonas janggokensis]QPL47413.1 SH3 domain-containing protein [Halomonas sp. A40-4]
MQIAQFCHRYRAVAAGVLVSVWCVNGVAQPENEAWVSDELSTYVRSGPTDGYRIVGTLNAGEQVEVLETSGDYTRVRGDGGDTVWILSDELQETPSATEQLPELESRVAALTDELDGINEEWEQRVATMRDTLEARQQRIDELETRNDQLSSNVDESSEQVRALQARLDTQEEDLLLRYFMYGGGVAGAGLVVGLIVPHLPRRRKKRDRWF